LVLLALLMDSCNPKEIESVETEKVTPEKPFVLQDKALKFESKTDLQSLVETIKKIGPEAFYKKDIKNLCVQGYEPLRPYFEETEAAE